MRSLWSGSISFGLVNIPVHMYTGSKDKELSFVMLHKKDMSQIRYSRICKEENKEVPWDEIVKGYEYEKGNYIIMEQKDFEKANLKKSKSIEIINFVEEDEVGSQYYVKPYFLEPDKNATKAYNLLLSALQKSKKVGLAKFVLHNREHLGIVKVQDNMMVLNELRYESELLQPKDLNIPKGEKVNGKELEFAVQLIDQLTVPFKPSEYKDTYIQEMKALIKQKSKGKPIHPKAQEVPKPSKVHDIMSLLQASLEAKKTKKSRKSA